MEIESPTFTAEDVQAFLREQREHERDHVVQRLEAVGERLRALGPRVQDAGNAPGGSGWNAREILAHIALVSKVYGVIGYKVGTGNLTEVDLLSFVQQRDVFGQEAAKQPVEDHLQAIAADHARTLQYLRSASIEDLERSAGSGIEGLRMTAFDTIRLAIVNHVEEHLEQLETALG